MIDVLELENAKIELADLREVLERIVIHFDISGCERKKEQKNP